MTENKDRIIRKLNQPKPYRTNQYQLIESAGWVGFTVGALITSLVFLFLMYLPTVSEASCEQTTSHNSSVDR